MSTINDNNDRELTREFLQFIASLRGVHADGTELGSPDGVTDSSDIVRALRWFTHDGRAVKSDEHGALTKRLGAWMQSEFAGRTSKDIVRCNSALSFMVHLILKAVQEIHPDTCPEEVLMVALDQDRLAALAKDLEATPYRLMNDGHVAPDFTAHFELAEGFVIDERVKHAFMRRHITPVHYDAHEQDTSAKETAQAEPKVLEPDTNSDFEIVNESDLFGEQTSEEETKSTGTRKVNLGDFGLLVASPLEGFDEFHHYFDSTDFIWWEVGVDFKDLPKFGEQIDSDDYPQW